MRKGGGDRGRRVVLVTTYKSINWHGSQYHNSAGRGRSPENNDLYHYKSGRWAWRVRGTEVGLKKETHDFPVYILL